MAFDRLIYIDRLKQAGMDDAMARAHADALRDALLETVATKADIAEVRTEIADVRRDVKELRVEMQAELRAIRAELQIAIRDLTVKGVAALAVVTSILIGVKFFG